jgi:hypothetical protein
MVNGAATKMQDKLARIGTRALRLSEVTDRQAACVRCTPPDRVVEEEACLYPVEAFSPQESLRKGLRRQGARLNTLRQPAAAQATFDRRPLTSGQIRGSRRPDARQKAAH